MACECAQVDGVDCNLVGLVYSRDGWLLHNPTNS